MSVEGARPSSDLRSISRLRQRRKPDQYRVRVHPNRKTIFPTQGEDEMTTSEQELLNRCTAIGVSSWSDALDELGIDGVLQGITQRSGSGRMCGFAVTARQLPGRLGDFDKSDFAVGALVSAAGPGKVLMVDIGGAPISTMGGLAALATKKQGASGVVIDGACRDLDEIRASELWVASRWVMPTTGKRRLKLQQPGETVSVGGIQVSQGDLVVGDDTGIIVVPRVHLASALDRAERIVAIDEKVEERIRAGESFGDAAAAAGYLPTRE
jgi:regulator of RNase E activity RraA